MYSVYIYLSSSRGCFFISSLFLYIYIYKSFAAPFSIWPWAAIAKQQQQHRPNSLAARDDDDPSRMFNCLCFAVYNMFSVHTCDKGRIASAVRTDSDSCIFHPAVFFSALSNRNWIWRDVFFYYKCKRTF